MIRATCSVLTCAALLALGVAQFDTQLLAGAAAMPDEPVMVSPANGATGVSPAPTLASYASDPVNGGMLIVTTSLRRLTADEFTIIVLPDTQYYSESYPATYTAQTQWIVNNREVRNIVFVTHEGDIVQTAKNAPQWERANTSMTLLDTAGIPYGLAPGNHDQPSTLFNQHFGINRFQGRSYYGGHYGSNNDNNYQLFSGGGMNFIAIHLDYCPSTTIVQWAASILRAHPDRIGMMTTHAYLGANGNRLSECNGQYMWDQLAVPNPNLRFMLSGHVSAEARRTDAVSGRTVHQMLADYQSRDNGGDGWLRIMRFVPAENKVYVQTYSPTLGQFESDASSEFALDFEMASDFQTVGTTVVPEGSEVDVTPAGLAPFTTYQWKITVTNDLGQTRTGPTWTFTTGAGSGAANQPPVATPMSVTVPEDASTFATLAGADPDGNTLIYQVVTGPAHGTLTGTAPNLTYQPAANYSGSDSFTFRVNDGQYYSPAATVSITVQPVNDLPSAIGDSHTASSGGTLTVAAPGVLGNDSDIDGGTLTALVGAGPAHGVLTLNTNGSFTYTPTPGYTGPDSFTYAANDGFVSSALATVAVTVAPPPPPPGSGNIKAITFEGGSITHVTTGADTTSGTVRLETALPIKGGYSVRIANSSSYLKETFAAAPDLYLSFYVRLSAVPSSDAYLLRILNNGSVVGAVLLRSNGALRLRNNSSNIGNETAPLVVGQLYRIGVHQKTRVGGTNNATIEGFVVSGEGPFGVPFAALTNGSFTSTATELRLGSVSGTVNVVLDDIKLDSAAMPAGTPGPTAPTGLAASAVSATSVQLTWTDASPDETAFRIERAGSSGLFSEIATVGADVISHLDATVTAATSYSYRVRGVTGSNLGAYSNVATVATPDVVPSPPSGLGATASGSGVLLSWSDASSNETLFLMERAGTDGIFSEIATVGANTTSHNDPTASPATSYSYRVRAANMVGYSIPSNTVPITTPLQVVPPAAPSNLNATAPAGSHVSLTWTDNTAFETSFRIERAGTNGIFSEIGFVAMDMTMFTDSTSPGSTLTYRVRAANGPSMSAYSNSASVTTPTPPGPSGQTLKLMTFETGTITDPVTGADSVSGTVTFETASPLKGSRSAKIAGAVYLQEDVTPAPDLYFTFYLRVPSLPSSDIRIMLIQNAGKTVGNLMLRSTGQLRLRNDSAQIGADSPALAAGTFYRVLVHQRTTPRLLEAFVAAGDNAFGPAFASSTTAPFTGPADRIRLGGTNGSVNAVFDDVRLETGSPTPSGAPNAPSALTAVAPPEDVVVLTWTDNAANEDTVRVERSEAGGSFVEIASLTANVTSYSDVTVNTNTAYSYRVLAVNGAGASGHSNQFDVTTPAAAAASPPPAPTELTVTGTTSTSVDLAWANPASNETSVHIERAVGGEDFVQIATLPADATSLSDIFVTSGITYRYRVRAANSTFSDYSNEVTIATP